MAHPDSVLIRRMLCGPIGGAKLHKLSPPAHNPASDLTKATRVAAARIDADAFVSNLAPVASPLSPPIATGAPCYPFPHTEDY
jgi:hypothetical protein